MVLNASSATKFLTDLEALLRQELLKTWTDQGHNMTGSIVETADFVIEQTINKLSFLLYMFPYGGYMETGVSASSIPFSGTGKKGGTSKYIQALIKYAKKRMNLPDKEAKGVAFAIAHKQKMEGMPTSASKNYSSTGSRTGWIEETMNRNRANIELAMFNYVDTIINIQFNNMVAKNQQLFNSTA